MIFGIQGGRRRQNKSQTSRETRRPKSRRWKSGGCPTVPRRRANAVGRCHRALLLCVVVAACRSTSAEWWGLGRCAPCPLGKELANSLLVGLQLVARCDGGRPRVLFWERGRGVCCGLQQVLVFLLACWCFLSPSWSCAVLRCLLLVLSENLTTVFRFPKLATRVEWTCLLDAPPKCVEIQNLGPSKLHLQAWCDCDTWGPT